MTSPYLIIPRASKKPDGWMHENNKRSNKDFIVINETMSSGKRITMEPKNATTQRVPS